MYSAAFASNFSGLVSAVFPPLACSLVILLVYKLSALSSVVCYILPICFPSCVKGLILPSFFVFVILFSLIKPHMRLLLLFQVLRLGPTCASHTEVRNRSCLWICSFSNYILYFLSCSRRTFSHTTNYICLWKLFFINEFCLLLTELSYCQLRVGEI